MGMKMIRGISISNGIGIGGIFLCHPPEIKVNTNKIDPEKIEIEITNLEVALCKTFVELFDLYNGYVDELSDDEKKILGVYHAILDDEYFFEEMKEYVRNNFSSAERAIEISMEKYISEILQSDSEYMKERISDLKDIQNRLIKNVFSCEDIDLSNLNSSHIAVVKELSPALAILLGKKKVQGVVSEEGSGYISHAAIILRNMGIPLVNGSKFDDISGHNNEIAILNAFDGVLIIDPEDPELDRYREINNINHYNYDECQTEKDMQLVTLDGIRVGISANIGGIDDFRLICDKNIDGIGLMRTETFFFLRRKVPSEKWQAVIYSKIARDMKPGPVSIRTSDLGGDKILGRLTGGLDCVLPPVRGIHWSLQNIGEFKIQLRAIMRASEWGNLKIMFPMVESANDIIKASKVLNDATSELINENVKVGRVKVGAVIETKLAFENLDEILDLVDFISIGTNDLLNQFSGVNRVKETLKQREFLNPNFLKVIKTIITKANEKRIPVSVCGEMASDPLAGVLLIGFGVNDLSVAPSKIVQLKRAIRDVYMNVARELAEKVVQCNDIDEVRHILASLTESRKW